MNLKVFDVPRRAMSVLSSIFVGLAAIMTLGYAALISLEVFARYIFRASQSWTFELAAYLFVVSVFFGTAVAFWERSHLSVVETSNSSLLLRLHRFAIDLICIVICGYLTYYGFKYAWAGLGRFSPSMGFKMAVVYATLPISFLASVLFIVTRWLGDDE